MNKLLLFLYNNYIMDSLKKIEFKRIKVANIIAIGGMIAAGKTTLTEALSKELNCDILYELDENDEIQKALLKGLYEKQDIAPSVFQLYFFLRRFENYKKASQNSKFVIVDRTVFEDRLFAHQNMSADPITFAFYDNMWKDKINELIYSIGLPRLYVILDLDWDTFKERLFKRNRKVETDNFNINEQYFKTLQSIYVDFLKQTCETFGIDYLVLDAKLSTEEKIARINARLASNEGEYK